MMTGAFEWVHLNQNDFSVKGENDFDVKTRADEHELTLHISGQLKRQFRTTVQLKQ